MRNFSLALLGLVAYVQAADDFDVRDLTVSGFVDPEECYSALEAADSISEDRVVDRDEYVLFVQELAPSDILDYAESYADLPLVLQSNFNALACLCQGFPDPDESCCIGSNAHLDTAGAFAGETPNSEQIPYLFLVCSLTTTSIGRVIESLPPSSEPTEAPTLEPTGFPTSAPVTPAPVVTPAPIVTPAPVVPVEPTVSPSPTEEPSASPTSSPTAPTKVSLSVEYKIGVEGNATKEVYEIQLVDAMNSLAPEVLLAIRRKLRNGRRLRSVQLSTSIDGFEEIGK